MEDERISSGRARAFGIENFVQKKKKGPVKMHETINENEWTRIVSPLDCKLGRCLKKD